MRLEHKEITKDDLKVGTTYFAKRRKETAFGNNDRTLVYVGSSAVQYDSDTVGIGRHYPSIYKEQFCKWAGGVVHFE